MSTQTPMLTTCLRCFLMQRWKEAIPIPMAISYRCRALLVLLGKATAPPQDAVLSTQLEQSLQQSSSSQMLEGHIQVAHVVSEDVIPAQLPQHGPCHSSGDDIVPLAMSPDRWIAPSTMNHQACTRSHSPEEAKRRFTGLLNKLTRVNIGFICDRIIAWVDECEGAVRGNVLELFSRLLFDRAVDEPERTGIYIGLCEVITGKLRGRRVCHGIKKDMSYNGTIISNYLTKCWDSAQESLSWGESISGSRTAKSATMLSVDEYYAAQKAKRRGLGLASLGVELWNSNVLSNPHRPSLATSQLQLKGRRCRYHVCAGSCSGWLFQRQLRPLVSHYY